jgi:hypothetical protein
LSRFSRPRRSARAPAPASRWFTQIITDSGGAIDVKSTPQQGSTFTIYLLLPGSEVTLAIKESGPATLARVLYGTA